MTERMFLHKKLNKPSGWILLPSINNIHNSGVSLWDISNLAIKFRLEAPAIRIIIIPDPEQVISIPVITKKPDSSINTRTESNAYYFLAADTTMKIYISNKTNGGTNPSA